MSDDEQQYSPEYSDDDLNSPGKEKSPQKEETDYSDDEFKDSPKKVESSGEGSPDHPSDTHLLSFAVPANGKSGEGGPLSKSGATNLSSESAHHQPMQRRKSMGELSRKSTRSASFVEFDDDTREVSHLKTHNDKLKAQVKELKKTVKELKGGAGGPVSAQDEKSIETLNAESEAYQVDIDKFKEKARKVNDIELLDRLLDELESTKTTEKTFVLKKRMLDDGKRGNLKSMKKSEDSPSRQKVFLELKDERRRQTLRLNAAQERKEKLAEEISGFQKRAEEAMQKAEDLGLQDCNVPSVINMQKKDEEQCKQLAKLRMQVAAVNGSFDMMKTKTGWIDKDNDIILEEMRSEIEKVKQQINVKEQLIMSNQGMTEKPAHFTNKPTYNPQPAPPVKKARKPRIPKLSVMAAPEDDKKKKAIIKPKPPAPKKPVVKKKKVEPVKIPTPPAPKKKVEEKKEVKEKAPVVEEADKSESDGGYSDDDYNSPSPAKKDKEESEGGYSDDEFNSPAKAEDEAAATKKAEEEAAEKKAEEEAAEKKAEDEAAEKKAEEEQAAADAAAKKSEDESAAKKAEEDAAAAKAEEDAAALEKLPKCKKCGDPIKGDFTELTSPDSGETFSLHNGDCVDAFQRDSCPKCTKCLEPIEGDDGVELDKLPYHSKCAEEVIEANREKCAQCAKPLPESFIGLTAPGSESKTVNVCDQACVDAWTAAAKAAEDESAAKKPEEEASATETSETAAEPEEKTKDIADQAADKKTIWAELKEKLPTTRSAVSKEKRKQLFSQFDPNGNGFLSLAEVDAGCRKELGLEKLTGDLAPILMRAFTAAKDSRKAKGKNKKHGDDYVEKIEFRLLFVYIKRYFELWFMFDEIDTSDDRRVNLEEFKSCIGEIESWGVKIDDPDASFAEIDTNGGGIILFQEFSEWAIKQGLDVEEEESDEDDDLPEEVASE